MNVMTRATSYFFALISLLVVLSVLHVGYVDYRNTELYFIIVLSIGFLSLFYSRGLNNTSDNMATTILGLYVLWLFISYLLSDARLHAWAELPILLSLPVMAIVWLSLRSSQAMSWKSLLFIIDVLMAFLIVWSFFDFFVTGKRATGPFLDTNAFAALLNVRLIPLFVELCVSGQKHSSRILAVKYLYLFFLASSVFMTQSRGAILALAVSLLVFCVWLLIKRISLKGWTIGLLIILASYLAVSYSGQGVSKRLSKAISNVVEEGVGNNSKIRIFLWKTGLEIYWDNDRLFGTGLGSFKSYYTDRRLPDDKVTLGHMAHNDYVQFLAEGGPIHLVFLLVIALALPGWLVLRAIRDDQLTDSQKYRAIGLGFALFYLALHAFVNFIYLVLGIAVIAGLYLGELIYLASRSQEAKGTGNNHKLVKLGVTLVAVVLIYKAVMEIATLGLFSSPASPIRSWTLDKTMPIARTLRILNPGNPATGYFLATADLQLINRVSDPEIRNVLLTDLDRTTDQLIDLDKRDPKALFLRANYLLSKSPENEDKAIALLRRSLELDPWFTDSAVLLSHLEGESAKIEEKAIKSDR